MDENKKIEIPAEVRTFLEEMLKDANMMPIDEAQREAMLAQLFSRLDSYITTVLVEKMPPEKLDEFIKLNESGADKGEIEKYLAENLPDATNVLAQAFADFRNTYMAGVASARNE